MGYLSRRVNNPRAPTSLKHIRLSFLLRTSPPPSRSMIEPLTFSLSSANEMGAPLNPALATSFCMTFFSFAPALTFTSLSGG